MFDLGHANGQGADDLGGEVILHRKHVRHRLVKVAGPKHLLPICIDELGNHPHAIADPLDAALDQIADGEAAADLRRARGLSFVGKDGVPRHDGQRGEATERVDDVLRQPVGEVVAG